VHPITGSVVSLRSEIFGFSRHCGCDSEIQGNELSSVRLQAPHCLTADRMKQNNGSLPAILHVRLNSGQPFQLNFRRLFSIQFPCCKL
jgi:hypothetical protein